MILRAAEKEVYRQLLPFVDAQYRAFTVRLMPTVPEERILGVRTPALRAVAGKIAGEPYIPAFLEALPHSCYELDQIHGFLIERAKTAGEAIRLLDRFLPFVDNWATCDTVSPKAFKKDPPPLAVIDRWLRDPRPYICRYGIGMLMRYYLDERFLPEIPERVAKINREEYYVNMMRAWFFATALAKQYEAIVPYLRDRALDPWTRQKTVQKACESYRITPEQKAYLKALKRKE